MVIAEVIGAPGADELAIANGLLSPAATVAGPYRHAAALVGSYLLGVPRRARLRCFLCRAGDVAAQ